MLQSIESGLPRIMTFWFGLALIACAVRISTSPIQHGPDLSTVMPYVLLVGAPLLSMGLALIWFREGDRLPQPTTRLSVVGRWRQVDPDEARRHPLYGSSGIMVSLLVGMLLNVPVRALEYLAAVPALAGTVPEWLDTLRFAMTLDVVLLTSLYTIAFVAALRRVPLFPRLLVAIWLVDIVMQLGIARAVAGTEGLPDQVGAALHTLLDGNVKKVLISVTPVAALFADVAAGERHLPPPRRGLEPALFPGEGRGPAIASIAQQLGFGASGVWTPAIGPHQSSTLMGTLRRGTPTRLRIGRCASKTASIFQPDTCPATLWDEAAAHQTLSLIETPAGNLSPAPARPFASKSAVFPDIYRSREYARQLTKVKSQCLTKS